MLPRHPFYLIAVVAMRVANATHLPQDMLKVNHMRYIPVEEARRQLGKLVREVSSSEPVVIGQRGTEQAVLISGSEYERLKRVEEEAARVRLRAALQAIGADVRRRRIPQKVDDEAVRKIRRR